MTASLPTPMIHEFLDQLDGAERSRTHRSLFDIVTSNIEWNSIPNVSTHGKRSMIVFTGNTPPNNTTFGDLLMARRPVRVPEVFAEFKMTADGQEDPRPKEELRVKIWESGSLTTEIYARPTMESGRAYVQVFVEGHQTRFPLLGYPHPIDVGMNLNSRFLAYTSFDCNLDEYQKHAKNHSHPLDNVRDGEIFCAIMALSLSVGRKKFEIGFLKGDQLVLNPLPKSIDEMKDPLLAQIKEAHERWKSIPKRPRGPGDLQLPDIEIRPEDLVIE